MKPGKPLARKTRIKPVSAKRRAFKASPEGKAGLAHMARVARLPCVCGCGRKCEEVHHCRDQPPKDYNNGMGPYVRLACAGRKSSDFDTIPMCKDMHDLYHLHRAKFHAMYGPDYGFLPLVAALLK